MKRGAGAVFSAISTAVMAAVGVSASALSQPTEVDRPPIEGLTSIREAYLASLPDDDQSAQNEGTDQVAQFRNFPNFPNFSNWRNR